MFDTMTLTKIIGAVCGAFLIFLFVSWAADSLYHTGPAGYGGEAAAQAYSIDTGEAAVAETAAEAAADVDAGPAFADLLAAADLGAGEKVFGKCKACHKIDGSNGTGPYLNGVIGRNHGAVEGYSYSEPMAALSALVWSPEVMNEFLTNPKKAIQGTKMTFAGLSKAEDRANVIAYLATLK